MTEITEFLKKISDIKPVRIFLPILGQDDRQLIQCLFKKKEGNRFQLIFKPGVLPVDMIDTSISCLIGLDIAGQSVSIESKIIKTINSQTLEMVPQKTISHEQMREYFRVDCTVPIILRSMIPRQFETDKESWEMQGTTVDLSGSGLRASFSSEPPAKTQVRLELALPTTEMLIVKTIASPVRITQLTKKLWDAAYQFDEIDDEDQDAIIGVCLVAQRHLLRLKVKVKW